MTTLVNVVIETLLVEGNVIRVDSFNLAPMEMHLLMKSVHLLGSSVKELLDIPI